MKKIVVSPVTGLMFLFLVLFSFKGFSQDDIILNNNDVIKGKVDEVGITTIRYHKATNMDGPSYDLAKADVYMIVYANGSSDVITPRANNSNPPAQGDNTLAPGDNTPAPDQPITQAPPPMPTYEQPYCPGEGYIWTPGYWAWGFAGYYWVPGIWITPPHYGLLWTPGYWGFGGSYYGWHHGYWANNVGYYGGVYYGYGYEGHGYYGGRWDGDQFRYNTSVTRVDVTVVHTTYVDNTVVHNNVVVNHSSFNGQGGVSAQPTPEEQKVMAAPHVAPTTEQQAHITAAKSDKTQYASVNGGKPTVAAMNKPNGQYFSSEGKPATPSPNSHPAAIAAPAHTAQPATMQHTTTTPQAEPATLHSATNTTAEPAQHTTGTTTQQSQPAAASPQTSKPATTRPTRKPMNGRPAYKTTAKPAPNNKK